MVSRIWDVAEAGELALNLSKDPGDCAGSRSGWSGVRAVPIIGDASTRRYWRLFKGEKTAILMLAPPEGRESTSQAALATSVVPFVVLASYLRSIGLSAPEVYMWDISRNVVILEDLGLCHYAQVEDKRALYEEAIEILLALCKIRHARDMSMDGLEHTIPQYSTSVLLCELEIWGRWAVEPDIWENIRESYMQAWRSVIDSVEAFQTLVLRDYHSPNFLWRAHLKTGRRLGILDFQDACVGHEAYDLVSLLQDARQDVPEGWEEHYLNLYLSRRAGVDRSSFLDAYYVLGAQRATKTVGIFHRLKTRDGKAGYVRHVPRVVSYLRRNFERSSKMKEVCRIMRPLLNGIPESSPASA